jgi:hypothetical protein
VQGDRFGHLAVLGEEMPRARGSQWLTGQQRAVPTRAGPVVDALDEAILDWIRGEVDQLVDQGAARLAVATVAVA